MIKYHLASEVLVEVFLLDWQANKCIEEWTLAKTACGLKLRLSIMDISAKNGD